MVQGTTVKWKVSKAVSRRYHKWTRNRQVFAQCFEHEAPQQFEWRDLITDVATKPVAERATSTLMKSDTSNYCEIVLRCHVTNTAASATCRPERKRKRTNRRWLNTFIHWRRQTIIAKCKVIINDKRSVCFTIGYQQVHESILMLATMMPSQSANNRVDVSVDWQLKQI